MPAVPLDDLPDRIFPATVAVVNGVVRIGLDDAALRVIATSDEVVKASNRGHRQRCPSASSQRTVEVSWVTHCLMPLSSISTV